MKFTKKLTNYVNRNLDLIIILVTTFIYMFISFNIKCLLQHTGKIIKDYNRRKCAKHLVQTMFIIILTKYV